MILNDMQRLRWQILDEALRDPKTEYFMGERTKTNETGNTRSLIDYVKDRLKKIDPHYSCTKRQLQYDVARFEESGATLVPDLRRIHKRILRYSDLKWKNPLLRKPHTLKSATEENAPKSSGITGVWAQGTPTAVTLRITGQPDSFMELMGQPEVLQRQIDVKSGSTTLTIQLNLSPALQAMLFGLSDHIEVLSPESLREDYRRMLANVQKFYGQTNQPKQKKGQLSLFDELF